MRDWDAEFASDFAKASEEVNAEFDSLYRGLVDFVFARYGPTLGDMHVGCVIAALGRAAGIMLECAPVESREQLMDAALDEMRQGLEMAGEIAKASTH